ncbi:MAG TPA: alpha/beta hydrolase [Candidatus Angelobacter sp.]|jgi:acetyl esterase|nr:alpha/beta hydrolase [Candidatus Angelobacter sp.]
MPQSSKVVLDPKTQWFLDFLVSSGRPQVNQVSVAEAREMYVKGQNLMPLVKKPAQVEDRTVPAGSGGNVKLRIFRPEESSGPLPVVMYFHGGGWVLGDADTYDYYMRELTNGTDAAVVFVEYSRSPEARYPVALEECFAATKWIAAHGNELNLNSSQIAVAGDSAGGNMAAVVCLLAKERSGPQIAAQVLIYPATGHVFNSTSFQEFATGYFLTRETSQWFWQQYTGGATVEHEPTACPLEATLEQLKGLPPALVITGECDVLRDEGEAYARKLMQAGVQVTCTRYMGAIHGFMGINALADTPPTKAARAQVHAMLREALATKTSEKAA